MDNYCADQPTDANRIKEKRQTPFKTFYKIFAVNFGAKMNTAFGSSLKIS